MVDDHAVELPFDANLLIVRNDDRPGMIGLVGSALGDVGVSITNMAVGQTCGGGTALMVLSTDRPVPPEVTGQRPGGGGHPRDPQRRRRLGVGDLSAEHFRQVMAHVPTSVAIVAGVVDNRPTGLSVGTFVPVSLEPPLVRVLRGEDVEELAAHQHDRVVLRQRARSRPG